MQRVLDRDRLAAGCHGRWPGGGHLFVVRDVRRSDTGDVELYDRGYCVRPVGRDLPVCHSSRDRRLHLAGDLPRARLHSDRHLDGDPAILAAWAATGGGDVAQPRSAIELQCRHGVVSQYLDGGGHRQLDRRRGDPADARHRGGDRGASVAAGRLAGSGRSRRSNVSRRHAPSGRAECSIASVS